MRVLLYLLQLFALLKEGWGGDACLLSSAVPSGEPGSLEGKYPSESNASFKSVCAQFGTNLWCIGAFSRLFHGTRPIGVGDLGHDKGLAAASANAAALVVVVL